jgi:hypothetical protein
MQKGFIDFLRRQISENTPYSPGEEDNVLTVVSGILERIRSSPKDMLLAETKQSSWRCISHLASEPPDQTRSTEPTDEGIDFLLQPIAGA